MYELTELGESTAPLLLELAALGGRFAPDEDLQRPGNLRTIAVTLKVACQRVAPPELDLRAQLIVGGEPFWLVVDAGIVDVKSGSLADPQVTMETEYEPMVAVGDGRMTLQEFASRHITLNTTDPCHAESLMMLLERAMSMLKDGPG